MQMLNMQFYHVGVATLKAAPGARYAVCHVGVWERLTAGGETSWLGGMLGLTQCVSVARLLARFLAFTVCQRTFVLLQ